MRERRNCVQVASSNLSLLEPTLCTSISYSSAMTLRRASVFCGNRVPLAPFQVLLVSYGMTASVMSYSIVLHDLQAVNTYPPLRGVLSHIAIAAVSYSRDRVPTTLTITGPTLTMRMAMGTSCAIQLLLLCQIF